MSHGPRRGRKSAAAAAIAVLTLAATADGLVRHGWNARYQTEIQGALRNVERTIEHRVGYPNARRALARYVQGWDFQQWGVPSELPPLHVELHGVLEVPEAAPRRLKIHSPDDATLEVEGHAYDRKALAPGSHALSIHWSGEAKPESQMVLSWQTPGGDYEPVPSSAITPRSGSWTPLRVALWIASPLLALFAAFAALWVHRASGPVRRNRAGWLVLTLVLIGALGLRLFDYSVMPDFRTNGDELFATWNGWQLLEDGTTRGWSLWAQRYRGLSEIETLRYFRPRPWHITRPYFEHPPLLHVLVGAAAHLGGAEHWAHARLEHTRLVPIALSLLSIALVWMIGHRVERRRSAVFFGTLLYAALPLFVLQHRVIKEEALLTPAALGMTYLFLRWREQEQLRYLAGAAVLAGACTLTKVPGLVFVVALAALIAQRRRLPAAVLATGMGLAVSALLLVFAAAIDWELFWFTAARQTERAVHWNIFARFFDAPLVNHNLIGRGWLLFLWLGWIAAVTTERPAGNEAYILPPLAYLVAIAIGTGNWTFGWYLQPVFPFLCLGAGRFLSHLWERGDLARGALFVTLLVMYTLNFTLEVEYMRQQPRWPTMRTAITVFTLLALVPYGLASVYPSALSRRLARVTTAFGVSVVLTVSAWFVVHYDRFFDEYRNFDRMEFFHR